MKNYVYYGLFLALIWPMPQAYAQRKDRINEVSRSNKIDADAENKIRRMTAEDEKIRKEVAESGGLVPVKLTKKDVERMKEMRKVNPTDLEKYKDFLKGDRVGIFRLFPNYNCITPKVIRIDGDCAGFVPESSYFSFRAKKYSDILNQDMGFIHDEFISGGFFSQGIFVSLGNVSLENVALDQPSVKFLAEIKPDTEAAAAKVRAPQFRKGVIYGEFTYASHAKAIENTTYAFRLIAYRLGNTLVPSSQPTMLEQLFISLDFDKRVDSIFAFRVMRMEPGGNATILWKELSRKDAPKLKFGKGETYNDFK
ncbi:MAG: hypothetical protein ABIP78_01340 [Pyrinomonadaceae bacterium]